MLLKMEDGTPRSGPTWGRLVKAEPWLNALEKIVIDAHRAGDQWFPTWSKLAPWVEQLVGWGPENKVVQDHLFIAWLTGGEGLENAGKGDWFEDDRADKATRSGGT